jgi:hypothetical protein
MYEAPGRFSILDFIIFKNNLYFIFNSSYFGEVAVIHVFAFLFLSKTLYGVHERVEVRL